MTSEVDIDAVEQLARERLGEVSTWDEPAGYPESLAMCAIDAAYSLRSRYTATIRVLNRYRTYRRHQGGDPDTDGASELLEAIEEVGGPAKAANRLFGNRATAPGTRGERLKSEALADAMRGMRDMGVETVADLHSAEKTTVRRAWQVKGLGPVSWDYLLMLSGTDGVKADTMVRRFVSTAVGEGQLVSKERAESAVRAAAGRLDSSQRAMDHAIWRFQRRVHRS